MSPTQLHLSRQICFPIYGLSRMITKKYNHFLKEFHLTYPQYLVLLVLWEKEEVNIDYIGQKLLLETNTLTPLLKRMQDHDILKKEKDKNDKRNTIIKLTKKGKELENKLRDIPSKLYKNIETDDIDLEDFKQNLDKILQTMLQSF